MKETIIGVGGTVFHQEELEKDYSATRDELPSLPGDSECFLVTRLRRCNASPGRLADGLGEVDG